MESPFYSAKLLGEYELPPQTRKVDIFHPQLSISNGKLPRVALQAVLVLHSSPVSNYFIKKRWGLPVRSISSLFVSPLSRVHRAPAEELPHALTKARQWLRPSSRWRRRRAWENGERQPSPDLREKTRPLQGGKERGGLRGRESSVGVGTSPSTVLAELPRRPRSRHRASPHAPRPSLSSLRDPPALWRPAPAATSRPGFLRVHAARCFELLPRRAHPLSSPLRCSSAAITIRKIERERERGLGRGIEKWGEGDGVMRLTGGAWRLKKSMSCCLDCHVG